MAVCPAFLFGSNETSKRVLHNQDYKKETRRIENPRIIYYEDNYDTKKTATTIIFQIMFIGDNKPETEKYK